MFPQKETSKKNRLAFQLGIPLVSFVIIILVALLVFTVATFRKDQEDARSVPRQAAQGISTQLTNFFERTQSDLRLASKNVEVRNLNSFRTSSTATSQFSSLYFLILAAMNDCGLRSRPLAR